MSTDELRNYATILAAFIALMVFIFNSRVHRRKQSVENLARFFEVHERLMANDGFLMTHLPELESGSFTRDLNDWTSERQFHQLLLHIEQLAILANNKAVPVSTQVYMFGLYSSPLLDILTEEEKSNMFWDLAVTYLKDLAAYTAKYRQMTPEQRKQFQR